MLSAHLQTILDFLAEIPEQPFVLTFSGRNANIPAPVGRISAQMNISVPAQKIGIKPVLLGERQHLQINVFTQKQHFTKNVEIRRDTLADVIASALDEAFSQAHIQSPAGDLLIRATVRNDGSVKKIGVQRSAASRTDWATVQEHNARKNYSITPENSPALLRALGICTAEGAIIPAMRAKYRQINHFLTIAETLNIVANPPECLRIADCGCGKAYLSLSLYHWLVNLRGLRVELTGMDSNAGVIDFCTKTAHTLGFSDARFLAIPIAEFRPEAHSLDVVIALHACDIATDDALKLALDGNAQAILSAPCCHHYINKQLQNVKIPTEFNFLLKDGIARERFADLLTDSFRRDILACYGYSAELLEFISPEHTLKNIMIRAERSGTDWYFDETKAEALRASFERWGVAPYLEKLLGLRDT